MNGDGTTREQKLRAVTAVMRRIPEGRCRDEILAALFANGPVRAPRGFRGRPAAQTRATAPREPREPRHRARCGTPPAYRRHLANGEEPCQPCRDAIAEVRRLARAAAAAGKDGTP